MASYKESKIVEGHLMGDQVHICISVPPKYSVSSVVGYLSNAVPTAHYGYAVLVTSTTHPTLTLAQLCRD